MLPAEGWRWGQVVWQVPLHSPYKVLLQSYGSSQAEASSAASCPKATWQVMQDPISRDWFMVGRKKHICHQEGTPMLTATAKVGDCPLSCNGKDRHAQSLPGPDLLSWSSVFSGILTQILTLSYLTQTLWSRVIHPWPAHFLHLIFSVHYNI